MAETARSWAFEGRREELAALQSAVDGLAAGLPAIFAIVGEAGMGKSRLLAEAARRAEDRDVLVLSGRAAEFEQEAPFGVFVDALDSHLGTLPSAVSHGLGTERMGELASIFPALAETAVPTGQPERHRAFYAVRSLLELIGGRRPTLLILDDMHWADQASRELLAHLLRRRPAAPIVIAVAFRGGQAPERLQSSLERAEKDGGCERLVLGPLSRSETDRLLGSELSPAARERLFEESRGNPFYLEQLSRAAERGVELGDRPRDEVPRQVAGLIQDELGLLDDAARRVLEGAAVAGDPFEPELAAAAAGVSVTECNGTVDELAARDLVRRDQASARFRFRHPIVRSAVYGAAPNGWRIAAHGRVADALIGSGAPAVSVAPHIERSRSPGDEQAAGLLVEAAQASLSTAPAMAARWFQAALRLLPETAGSDARLEILVPLAQALGYSGQLEQSRSVLWELFELLPPDQGAVKGRVAAFMSLVEHLLGGHGEARQILRQVLDELPASSPQAERAMIEVELAADCFFLGEWEELREWAGVALARARKAQAPVVSAAALSLLGLSHFELLNFERARESVLEAGELIDGAGDEDLAAHVHTCLYLGWAEYLVDEFDRSVRHLDRGIAISRRHGQVHMVALMTLTIAIVDSWRGRLDSARKHAEEAVELAHLAGSDQLLAWAQTARCLAVGRGGSLEEAIAAGEEAVGRGAQVTSSPYTMAGRCWLADALLEGGDPSRAKQTLLGADGLRLSAVEPSLRGGIGEALTRAELALGDVKAARAWTAATRDSTRGSGPRGESFALRAEAAVAAASGDPARAAELAREAAVVAGSLYPFESARARLTAGRALAAAGDTDGSVEELGRACAQLEACGASRYAGLAARELAELGVRGGPRIARAGLDVLNDREGEIAELVAERLTNRQIGDRLALSVKTVERVMSNIFEKLNVSSRVEVARRIDEVRPLDRSR